MIPVISKDDQVSAGFTSVSFEAESLKLVADALKDARPVPPYSNLDGTSDENLVVDTKFRIS